MKKHYRIIIIGSGPAIYAARGELKPIVISGNQPGGQLMLTSDVENFPGFDKLINCSILMERMRRQAERFGTQFVDESITEVDFTSIPLKIRTSSSGRIDDNIDSTDNIFLTEFVVVVTGASAIWLGLESEQRRKGKGVSSCATCDGFFFKGKDVVVVGGGDTAIEEALFLSKLANSVKVIRRRSKLKASVAIQKKAFNNNKISFLWDSVITEIIGFGRVEGIRVKSTANGHTSDIKIDAVFVAIGHKPNTEIFDGQLEFDERSYSRKYNGSKTNIKGVFVAGDTYDYMYRRFCRVLGSYSLMSHFGWRCCASVENETNIANCLFFKNKHMIG